jgi:predicted ATPase with chaperone activity
MLARRLTTILPALRLAEALETTRLPRVAGRTGARPALATARSFHGPPHTVSDAER